MKKLLVIPLFSIFILPLWGQSNSEYPVSKLNGAYKMSKMKYGNDKDWVNADDRLNIKVFKDGYWFSGSLKKGNTELNGLCGGTYNLKNGKYNEQVDFYSWDSTAVGGTYTMDYKISETAFQQYGKMNSVKWPNYDVNEVRERVVAAEPLKNNGLEGAWLMQEGYWGGTSRFGEGKYKGFTVVKIFSYPYAVYAYYDVLNKKFDGGGVVRYQFDGQTLTETNELWTWDMKRRGKSETHKITLQDGKFIQEGWEGKLREVYSKAPTKLWTEADRQYTLNNMKRSRDELIKETENLTPAQWAFHESSDRWSIGEVVEHLALWEIIWNREISMGTRNKPTPELNATSKPDSYYNEFIMEDAKHNASDYTKPVRRRRPD